LEYFAKNFTPQQQEFKMKKVLLATIYSLLFVANASAIDFGKASKITKKASAELGQIAKKLEKLQSDKIKVSEDERGVVLTFSAQLFAVGKADLTDEAEENLQEAAKTLAEYPNANVEIEGHADSTGSAKLNQDLSERRAKSVMNFLIKQGITKERLSAVGYGKDRPIADNGTEEGRAANRRVELIVKMEKKQKKEPIERDKEGIRFGIRGNAGLSGLSDDLQMTNDKTQSTEDGFCVGLGAFALIPFASIYFVPEISLEYRKPVNNFDFKGETTITETALDIPLFFRFRYREENLIYLGIGPLLGLVLDSQIEHDGQWEDNKHRSKVDFGIAMELGFRINDNLSIDIRTLVSFTSFGILEYLGDLQGEEIGTNSPSLIQFQLGVNYLF
jgi:outer membrane protein OmpA-like peptidoglycan-associated protein